MVLVDKDDSIKWFNSALLAKMKEYNIVLPHLNDLKMLNFNNLQKVEDGLADELNYKDWFDDTIACWDISQGCQGCNNKQFDYTLCNAGCFGTNTGCAECVNREEVNECQGCNSDNSGCTICNAGCESCVGGCFGTCNACVVCNSNCYGCNGGCQGAQTCISCNTGQGCVTGCQGDYTAGCARCNDDYTYCREGHTPACNRSQAEYGCLSCNTGCQNEDICSGYSACTTCVSCDSGNTCIVGNTYIESGGCTTNDKSCSLFYFGTCKSGHSVNSDGATTCKNTFSNKGVSCSLDYKVDRATGLSCTGGFGTDSGELNCSSNFSSDGSGGNYCKAIYRQGDTSCQGDYDSSIRTGEGNGISCVRSFAQGGSSCYYKYTGTQTTAECVATYVGRDGSFCDSGFKINTDSGYADCPTGFTSTASGGINCRSGYSFSSVSGHICVGGFTAQGIDCPSNYNNTCSACNTSSDNVCVTCNNGQAEQCTQCVGTGNNANCSGCVSGVASGCTECVDGDGGCAECQSCDSGCNANVSCAGYAVGDNGQNICVGIYTDTTCNQTCSNGFDSSSMCLSGQGCASCDTCQGCDGCQGCNSCQGGDGSGCESCDSGCNACNTCQGCDSCQGCVGCVGCVGNHDVCSGCDLCQNGF